MPKYRKRPIIVEAFQFGVDELPEWIDDAIVEGSVRSVNATLAIDTNEGTMVAMSGDWVIKEPFANSNRKIYPCKDEIFRKTYEKVNVNKDGGK